MWPYQSYQFALNDLFPLQFLNKTSMFIVKFEDLVGSKGDSLRFPQITQIVFVEKPLNSLDSLRFIL